MRGRVAGRRRFQWEATWRGQRVGCAGTANAAYDGASWGGRGACASLGEGGRLRRHHHRRRRPSCP